MSQTSESGTARTSPAPRLRLPLWKKLCFAAVATALFFVAVETLLYFAGLQPALATLDPFVGFSSGVPLFVEGEASSGPPVMVTAPNRWAYFNHQQFSKEKPAGTYRIFCLGGSTTYGRPYDHTTSFPGWLGELLATAAPGTNWEVINAGGISYASYRVAAIMEELAEYQPDLFVVYTGHNEFLEDRTYRQLREMPPALLRLSSALAKLRTYHLVYKLVAPEPKPPADRFLLPSEVDARLDDSHGPEPYHRDDAQRERIIEHFAVSLDRMVAIARGSNARILLVVPSSNRKDRSPLKSEHRQGLSKVELSDWQQAYDRGITLASDGHHDEAIRAFAAAEKIDDRYAELHFRKGKSLLVAKRISEAGVAFDRALDEDVCPLRALPEIGAAVRSMQDRANVPVVDFESLLQESCARKQGHRILGAEFFLDHVHPTIEANRELAVAIVEQLRATGVVAANDDWQETALEQVTRRIRARIGPEAEARALLNRAKVLNWAGQHEEAGPLALQAVEILADDAECLLLSAAYLKSIGQVDRAIAHYRKSIAQRPNYAEAHQLLGAVLVERGELSDALVHFREVARLKPKDAHAHHTIGAILAELGRYEASIAAYQRALAVGGDDPNVHYNLAFALANLDRFDKAEHHYRRTIELNSLDADARYNLGLLLSQRGKLDAAGQQFRRALEIRPQFDEARTEWQRVIAAQQTEAP